MPRFAAIDVGSNALRLRIIEASAPSAAAQAKAQVAEGPAGFASPPAAPPGKGGGRRGPWRDLVTLRSPVRLGTEVFLSGRLAPASIGQACEALRSFRAEMDRRKVDAYRAVATSAVREAKNGATLVERARREAGIALEVDRGHRGGAPHPARRHAPHRPRRQARPALVDVGGGSTELTLVHKGESDLHDVASPRHRADARGVLEGGEDGRPQRASASSRRPSIAPSARPCRSSAPSTSRRHGRQRRDPLRALPRQEQRAGHRRRRGATALQEDVRDEQHRAAGRSTSSGPTAPTPSCPRPPSSFGSRKRLELSRDPGARRRPRGGRPRRARRQVLPRLGRGAARPSAFSRRACASAAATTSTRRTPATWRASRRSSSTTC